jgi:SAM-dependent methyltransferase
MHVPDVMRTAIQVFTARGRRASHLAHKREYHRRRHAVVREVLAEARTDASLFRENCCPACGVRAPQVAMFTNPVGLSFAECPTDGTVYMDPVPSESTIGRLYNSEAYTFNWTAGQTTDGVPVKAKRPRELDHIRRVTSLPIEPKPRLLDVGCATGAFLRTASPFFQVQGIELNSETAAIARHNGFDVTTGRLEDLTPEPRFDVITMLQVIEHIADPAALLRHAKSLLRPSGIIYINTPAVDSASFHFFRERHSHVSSFAHVSLFTRASWPVLSDRVGLTVLAHEYCGDTDIALHDVVTWYLARRNFQHRMALYSPRLFFASRLIDRLSLGVLRKALSPTGHSSYQWVALQKQHTT